MEQQNLLLGLRLVVFRLVTDLVFTLRLAYEFKLIQDQLDKRDVEMIRLVSRACRHISEPILVDTLTLHDAIHQAEDVDENTCDRLSSRNDDPAQCVRHVVIGPFKHTKIIPSAGILHQILPLSGFHMLTERKLKEI